MSDITLLLVDDHDIVRTGLKSFLDSQPGLRVVAEARNGSEALELARDLRPTIALMDISMPDMDGLQATRRFQKECPETRVLALTVHDDKQYFMEMLAAGASGYLTKRAVADELIAAVHALARGQIYLQPALARWLIEDYQRLAAGKPEEAAPPETADPAARSLAVLTARERQVLELIAQGNTNIEIGEQLGLSHKTIARHRERIMNRLNLHSRTELVKFAIRTRLIGLE
jgi:DNA-binding NarL/FixJ family response regulator